VARYYQAVAHWALPHIEGRPLTLVWCPAGLGGECTYMKHSKLWAPDIVRRVRIPEKKKTGEYLVVEDIKGLITLVQMGVLEFHTWNSRFDDVEKPNRIVIDLDPGEEVPWPEVVAAARQVRRLLGAIDLDAFPKTTGGRGLHVVVPIRPEHDWRECLAFAKALAGTLVRDEPERYTMTFAKAGRSRRILIDYLRNNRTNTSVAAFSTRARRGAPVSMPVQWDDLSAREPGDFTLRSIPDRLNGPRSDPWRRYWASPQRLTAEALEAVTRLGRG
jgi:bifunctional non-homologous end joining protein LigD